MNAKKSWMAASAMVAIAVVGTIVARGQGQSYSFYTLAAGYAQHEFGITSTYLRTGTQKGYLGGVAVLQNGDVIAAECLTNGTQLHRFSASAPLVLDANTGLFVHQETLLKTAGGCG